MAITYDEVIHSVRQLPPEERRRLREELALWEEQSADETSTPFVEFLRNAEPIRPDALDAMERAIKDELEVVDPRDW